MTSAVEEKTTSSSPLTTFGGTAAHMQGDDAHAPDKPRLKRGTFVGALEPLDRYRGAGVLVVHDDAVGRRSLSRGMEV